MTLKRTLEPEVMDTPAAADEYDAMDHREVNEAFVRDLLAEGPVSGEILDLGTGTARIPVELCRQQHDCRVVAVDLAAAMLELARYHIEAAGLAGRIRLERVDAKQLPYPEGQFDAVISNSIVHHVPEPLQVLREAVRVTRLGGRLFFRDLLRPASESRLEELVEAYAGQESEQARRMLSDSLRAALTLDEIRAYVTPLGFDAETVNQTSDRHWTWSAQRV